MAEYRRYLCGYAGLLFDNQVGPVDQELDVEGYAGLLPLDSRDPMQQNLIRRARESSSVVAALPAGTTILRTPQEIGLPEGIAFDNSAKGLPEFILYSEDPSTPGNRRIPFSEEFEAYAIMLPRTGNMRRRIVQEVIVRQRTPLH